MQIFMIIHVRYMYWCMPNESPVWLMCFCVHLTAGSAGILHPHSVYIPLHHCHGVVHSAPQYPSHYLPYTKVRYHVLPKLLCIGTSANFCIHQKSRSKIKGRVTCILLTLHCTFNCLCCHCFTCTHYACN